MKKKLLIPIISVILLILIICSFLLLKDKEEIQFVKNTIYCGFDRCYVYNGKTLTSYETEEADEGAIVFGEKLSTCKFNKKTNDCKEKIIRLNKKNLLIQNDEYSIDFYTKENLDEEYNEKEQKQKEKENEKKEITFKKDISGKFFKNDNLELYFIDKNENLISGNPGNIIIAGKGILQRQETYSFEGSVDEFYNLLTFNTLNHFSVDYNDKSVKYTYNINTKEILGLKRDDIKNAKYISLDYYDSDGKIKEDSKYIINGAYKLKNKEVLIYNNKILSADAKETYMADLKIIDANDTYVYYESRSSDTYTYKIKTKEICENNLSDCVSPVSKEELKLINTDYYNEDLSVKDPNINIDGAYKYETNDSTSEIYITNNTLYLIEYANKDTKEKTNKYKLRLTSRTDDVINYTYITPGKNNVWRIYYYISYNIKDNTIRIIPGNTSKYIFKKINKSELEYIDIK